MPSKDSADTPRRRRRKQEPPPEVIMAWPLGFAPPAPPSRMLVRGPEGEVEVSSVPFVNDRVIEVEPTYREWEEDE